MAKKGSGGTLTTCGIACRASRGRARVGQPCANSSERAPLSAQPGGVREIVELRAAQIGTSPDWPALAGQRVVLHGTLAPPKS